MIQGQFTTENQRDCEGPKKTFLNLTGQTMFTNLFDTFEMKCISLDDVASGYEESLICQEMGGTVAGDMYQLNLSPIVGGKLYMNVVYLDSQINGMIDKIKSIGIPSREGAEFSYILIAR